MPPEIRELLLGYLILLASLSLRQFGKAWMIDRLGDPNPRADGQLSFNPMMHFDPIGTGFFPVIFLYFFGSPVYGWAKHMYPRVEYFKNRVRGEILSAIAGSICNIVVCILVAIVGGLLMRYQPKLEGLFLMIIAQNALLAVFTLLPIPPLDGAILLKHALKMSEEDFMRFTQFSFIILLGFILAINIIPGLHLIIGIPFALIVGPAQALMNIIAGY